LSIVVNLKSGSEGPPRVYQLKGGQIYTFPFNKIKYKLFPLKINDLLMNKSLFSVELALRGGFVGIFESYYVNLFRELASKIP
jgi:hypothetical protein